MCVSIHMHMYMYLCICDVGVVSGAEIVEGGGKGESFILCSPYTSVLSPHFSAEGAMGSKCGGPSNSGGRTLSGRPS